MATVIAETYPMVLSLPSYEVPHDVRERVLNLSKMLADPTRLRICYYLTNEPELNVSQLCERVGQSQPAVSHHLAMMRSTGIVDHRRAGRQIFYSIRGESMRGTLAQLFAPNVE
jgi:DNA-binding transcriptional ArsR family regulator